MGFLPLSASSCQVPSAGFPWIKSVNIWIPQAVGLYFSLRKPNIRSIYCRSIQSVNQCKLCCCSMIMFLPGWVTYTMFPSGAPQLLLASDDTNIQILVLRTLSVCATRLRWMYSTLQDRVLNSTQLWLGFLV